MTLAEAIKYAFPNLTVVSANKIANILKIEKEESSGELKSRCTREYLSGIPAPKARKAMCAITNSIRVK